MNPRKPIPGLLSIPGATVPLVGELFMAAADYYRQTPWRWMENWLPIEIRFPSEGPERYALVLGKGGEIFGLSLYASMDDLDVVFERSTPEQPTSRPITWLSVVLEEATSMSYADLDAVEQYGWPVASEQAYPLVLKATPGDDWGELPNASELVWLAAALRVIPDFVNQHLHAQRGMPHPAQAAYFLSGVYGNQRVSLHFPPGYDLGPETVEKTSSPTEDADADLEDYISDWHWDEASHVYARQVGVFLFQFFDYLDASGLSHATIRKHESNCWCIGWLDCQYGGHTIFTPDIFLGGPFYVSEFKRKVSDSNYAINSYQATWRKLEKYVRSLESLD